MKKLSLFFMLFVVVLSCKEEKAVTLTSQEIVDKAIAASGGNLYKKSDITFDFRDRTYVLENKDGNRILKRITTTDTAIVTDVRSPGSFHRLVNDSLVQVVDSMANKYSNSVNSVHYFAYLPYGLNDAAVNKELLGKTTLNDTEYYKLKITFDQEGGGEDFEDTYIYWFNAETFKPDYLAYDFHVDGGGIRFREAYNERNINGIRFVDYNNYKPKTDDATVEKMDSLFMEDKLELLSRIELKNITVRPSADRDNYN